MSEATPTGGEQMSRDDMMSALFAHMIMQQSNIAMMMLGKVAHPETGKTIQDLDGAKLFIDQLEMIEAKTKGNLSKEEENLLKQALMSLRMAFVETVNAARAQGSQTDRAPEAPRKESAPADSKPAEPAQPAEESHKKFSKKY